MAIQHSDITAGEIHIVHNWSYADAAARTGATGFVSGDLGKVARQVDENSYWTLTATTPTWAVWGGTAPTISLTNATGLPVAGVSGLGTGVATALAVNVGSAGAPVVNGGALGTPSSGNLSSCTNPAKVDVWQGSEYAADAGANDSYAITLSPAITTYVTGTRYRFKANTANTGAATLDINAVGAQAIKKVAGGVTTALDDSDIRAGQMVEVVWDGTNFQMISASGNAGSGGLANPMTTEGDIIVGGASGTPTRLAIGAAGTVPTSTGTTLSYQSTSDIIGPLLEDIQDFVTEAEAILTYVSNNDDNGVVYFLGSAYDTTSFSNPHTSGEVEVVFSDAAPSAGTPTDLVDRAGNAVALSNVPNNWIAIDLGVGRTLTPNKYTLRQRNNSATQSPRNWKIQGTNVAASNSISDLAAATWTDLDVRTNDSSLATADITVAFDVTGVTTGYRYLRMLQNGVNNGGADFLCICEFEFYGTLAYQPDIAAAGQVEFTGGVSGIIRTAGAFISALTGNQDNFDTDDSRVLQMTNASAATIRGVAAGYNGQELTVLALGADTVTINHQDANSTAENRIITSTGAALVLAVGERADLTYETTNDRWRAWKR
jgi:hypothetical protein